MPSLSRRRITEYMKDTSLSHHFLFCRDDAWPTHIFDAHL